ncbi:hypothetical protein V8F20_002261 [Naviculisporaceae sp. PSN 640]
MSAVEGVPERSEYWIGDCEVCLMHGEKCWRLLLVSSVRWWSSTICTVLYQGRMAGGTRTSRAGLGILFPKVGHAHHTRIHPRLTGKQHGDRAVKRMWPLALGLGLKAAASNKAMGFHACIIVVDRAFGSRCRMTSLKRPGPEYGTLQICGSIPYGYPVTLQYLLEIVKSELVQVQCCTTRTWYRQCRPISLQGPVSPQLGPCGSG